MRSRSADVEADGHVRTTGPNAAIDPWVHSPFRHNRGDGNSQRAPIPEEIFEHPALRESLRRFERSRDRKRVCVIGGGIAGLTAAYELSALGHHVTLLESAARWGGRIFTHRFADGSYGELGAMRIPVDHGCVNYYVSLLGLAGLKRTFVPRNIAGWYLLRETRERLLNWPNIARQYQLRPLRFRPPNVLLDEIVLGSPMSPAQRWEALSNRIDNVGLRRIEDMALGEFVRREGIFTDEEWEYVGHGTGHIWLERVSLLHWRRESDILDNGGKYELVGGMDQLVAALVTRLAQSATVEADLQSRVTQVDLIDDGVDVAWEHPFRGRQQGHFDHVVCAVPAPATLAIRFVPALPVRKVEALSNLSYVSAGKTLMRCRSRHWETNDGIYGGTSITDRPNQQCWYPSDNSQPVTDQAELEDAMVTLVQAPLATIAQRLAQGTVWKAIDKDRSSGPGVLLAAYVWGTNGRRFASMSDAERTEMTVRSVEEIHPGNEQLLEEVVHWSWDEAVNPGGGAFAFFAPGEQRRYQELLCEPISDDRGDRRVFFAGEHMGIAQGWIQGAIQSAIVAVTDILGA
jgi:monoamine oxidase